MFDAIKSLIRDQLGIPAWAALPVVGLIAFFAFNVLLRRPWTSALGLLAPLILGIVLEAYEIRVQYRGTGLGAAGNDPLWIILGRHGLDVALMASLPVVAVATRFFSSR
jgi:hypothetical protein